MQLVRMRHCRAEDEGCASAFRSLKRDRRLAWLEDREFTVGQLLAAAERAFGNRDPANGVTSQEVDSSTVHRA